MVEEIPGIATAALARLIRRLETIMIYVGAAEMQIAAPVDSPATVSAFARPATMVTVTLIFSPGIVLAMHLTWITFRVSVRSVQERDGETWPQVSCSRLG